jgi:hypothetical protein
MRFLFPATLLAAIALCGAQAQTVGQDYAQAQAQSKEDALNPAYREWYLSQLRPAFTTVLSQALAACLPMDVSERPGLGLVMVLDQDGKVSKTLMRGESPVYNCLQGKLETHRFPAGPKADFHFGFEINASPSKPRTRIRAEDVAAQVGAPEVPTELDCEQLRVSQGQLPSGGIQAGTLSSGWTVVAFELEGDGQPKNVRIANSTAQARLDRFALEMVAARTYRGGITQSCQWRMMVQAL